MVNFSRSELLDLFLQEVESYIPEMENSLNAIVASGDTGAVDELHRLFHNVKGAAAQVSLTHLSRGARLVEDYLSDVIAKEQPLPKKGVEAIKKAVELLTVFIGLDSPTEAAEKKFCLAVQALSWPQEKDSVAESDDDILATIQSILPLLVELGNCLASDLDSRNKNSQVYARLSTAFETLVELSNTKELKEQSLLFDDFCHLLNSLARGGHPCQDEIAGMVRDFLGFLVVAFSKKDKEQLALLGRIHTQLRQVVQLLSSQESPDSHNNVFHGIEGQNISADDLFGDSEAIDESLSFLDELYEVDLPEGTGGLEEEESEVLDFFSEKQDVEDDFILPAQKNEGPSEDEKTAPAGENQFQEYSVTEHAALAEIFKEECEEHFITIHAALNRLEKQTIADPTARLNIMEPLREIRRAVHTLKGAASITGVKMLADGAHRLEDMLDWLYDHDQAIAGEEIGLIGESVEILESLAGREDKEKADLLAERITSYLETRGERPENPEKEIADEDVISLLSEAEHGADEARSLLPEDSGTLRVRLSDLDELLSIEGELVVARGAIEKMVDEFRQTLGDLENVKENLRRKSQELESGFEVQALYGGRSASGKRVAPLLLVNDQEGNELDEFDPIELDRYSELNLIIRSLNEISVDVNSIYSTLQSITGGIGGQVSKQQLTMRQMQDKLMRIRMTPLSSISRVLYGAVRSAAAKLAKPVDFTIVGEDVYMDRFVWAQVTDPLVHILRNAVDHGIETANDRLLAGKQKRGRITMRAEQRSRYVVLHIADDGAGIDVHRLKQKLSALKIVKDPESLDDKELLEYIFYPGFSTKKDVSELSGRGVGLDVVKRNIQNLRGSIHLNNNPGKGVRFEIHIPFTLSVNRAVLVSVAGAPFAIPLQDIESIRQFKSEDITRDNEELRLSVEGDSYLFSNLASYVSSENAPLSTADGTAIVFSTSARAGAASEHIALSVPEILEQREIIVKSLGSHLTHVRGISGVTVSGAGDLIPILNLRELVDVAQPMSIESAEVFNPPLAVSSFKVLIVDDSISVRFSIARLVESHGWQQQQAVDGVEALAQLENYKPDVIILDIEMPRMNGYELKSNLNNREEYRDIPVVMLTSRASEKHQTKARELGISYYLTKPYEEDNFLRLLEKIEGLRN
ncbi:response regulator [Desulforhopalus sp. IMCC35007]|uniref:hybrid sensor histidine kinase/response regulator n=1 Tax=Desulforhopalus sp. IMCC35007 TaxID=2569543 RepID=UPI0010AEB3F5|nr:response regulator [Desulforhopalus sp. IMCC35007]TKB09874.1 response regulator [Desulforhopalus sp. IMCC35007]